jgi:tRNA-splicing ligase RtcB (3'-phosphate/5'-hydroxy nucleic acid ligase)
MHVIFAIIILLLTFFLFLRMMIVMKNIDGILVFGEEVDQGAMSQIKTCFEAGAEKAVLTADHHKGYSVPIGGVLAYKNKICVSGVGFDIGCGCKAIKTDADPVFLRKNISRIMDEVVSKISFGVGRINNENVDHDLFYSDVWNIEPLNELKDLARSQLGTVGDNNHYCDLFVDESNSVWIGCHFGSRGFGHKTATYFLDKGGSQDGMDAPPLVLDLDSDLGQAYFQCMNLAGQYAYAGRDWVCSKVAQILGANIVEEVHNHHNFSWVEEHFGETYHVVRKGATPCFPNQKSFIGSSMAEPSVIVKGVDSEQARLSLYSTVHGAGRVMGRMEAKGKFDRKTGECKRAGKVTRTMMNDWLRNAKVELRGGDVDESPDCYKRLDRVLACHSESLEILHTLYPVGVAMAGEGDFDPYRD